jgi:undecaprenyl-diphosphatase
VPVRSRTPWVIAACLAAVAALFGLSRWAPFVAAIDRPISDALRALGGGPADSFTVVLSSRRFLGALLAVILGAFALVDRRRLPHLLAVLAVGVVLLLIGNELLLKRGLRVLDLDRARPYLASGDRGLGTTVFRDSSFPSSHMTGLVAALGIVTLHARRAWPALALGWLLMAFARIHAGMHYPSDVLAGTLLGVVYALAAAAIVDAVRKRPGDARG